MEFLQRFPLPGVDAAGLQQAVVIARLAEFCASIDRVLEAGTERGRIYCIWGEFTVHRELIRGGLRFTLPHCPNALAWTLTRDPEPAPGLITLHCTINRSDPDPDFAESIEVFLADWHDGLSRRLAPGT